MMNIWKIEQKRERNKKAEGELYNHDEKDLGTLKSIIFSGKVSVFHPLSIHSHDNTQSGPFKCTSDHTTTLINIILCLLILLGVLTKDLL
jgi:hypothetical protein